MTFISTTFDLSRRRISQKKKNWNRFQNYHYLWSHLVANPLHPIYLVPWCTYGSGSILLCCFVFHGLVWVFFLFLNFTGCVYHSPYHPFPTNTVLCEAVFCKSFKSWLDWGWNRNLPVILFSSIIKYTDTWLHTSTPLVFYPFHKRSLDLHLQLVVRAKPQAEHK